MVLNWANFLGGFTFLCNFVRNKIYVLNETRFQVVLMARDLKFEDITFYNPSVYHYNLYDKQNCIITGWATEINE